MNDSDEQLEEETFEPLPQTESARATATLGMTVMYKGRPEAWPKVEYSDSAMPGETADQLLARVNAYAVNGVIELAGFAQDLVEQIHDMERKESTR